MRCGSEESCSTRDLGNGFAEEVCRDVAKYCNETKRECRDETRYREEPVFGTMGRWDTWEWRPAGQLHEAGGGDAALAGAAAARAAAREAQRELRRGVEEFCEGGRDNRHVAVPASGADFLGWTPGRRAVLKIDNEGEVVMRGQPVLTDRVFLRGWCAERPNLALNIEGRIEVRRLARLPAAGRLESLARCEGEQLRGHPAAACRGHRMPRRVTLLRWLPGTGAAGSLGSGRPAGGLCSLRGCCAAPPQRLPLRCAGVNPAPLRACGFRPLRLGCPARVRPAALVRPGHAAADFLGVASGAAGSGRSRTRGGPPACGRARRGVAQVGVGDRPVGSSGRVFSNHSTACSISPSL